MNLTDFRDNSLLKLQVGGPFLGGMEAVQEAQEYILIQVEQTEEAGPRRRRAQQVRVVIQHSRKEQLCALSYQQNKLLLNIVKDSL